MHFGIGATAICSGKKKLHDIISHPGWTSEVIHGAFIKPEQRAGCRPCDSV